MELFGSGVQILAKSLDLRMINHRVIGSNIANVDTPGFQAKRMDFQASLQRAIQLIESTEGGSLLDDPGSLASQVFGADASTEPVILLTGEEPIGLDVNNVNMEAELGKLAHNSLMYQLTAQLLAAKMRQIKMILENEGP